MGKILLALLFYAGLSYGITKSESCYRVEFLFFDVARLCIFYELDKTIKTGVNARTTGIFRLLKDVSYSGYAIADRNFNPVEFYFYKKEKNEVEIHQYEFSKEIVEFHKKIIKGRKTKEIHKSIKNENYIDPFTGSLYYIRRIKAGLPIKRKVFYNGKGYFIPYKNRKTTKEGIYAEIDPSKIKVGGIIQPTGIWKIWVSREKDEIIKGIFKIKVGFIKIKKIN